MSSFLRVSSALAGLGLLAPLASVVPATLACGPVFPNRLLMSPDEAALSLPAAVLYRELERVVPAPVQSLPVVSDGGAGETTAAADIGDLTRALQAAGADASTIEGAVALATRARAAATVKGAMPDVTGLPAEFGDYLVGAAAWHAGRVGEAQVAWQKVLSLPAAERRHRSTWAAYMLARSYSRTSPTEARRWYAETRRMAARPDFEDSLGLAVTSLGWEARLAGPADKLKLYAAQARYGDSGGLASIRVAVRALLTSGSNPELALAGGDPIARQVVTAELLARTSSSLGTRGSDPRRAVTRWLDHLSGSGAKNLAGADRLAWLAYRYGDYDAAARWVKLGKKGSTIAKWVRAKLYLRAGKLNKAAALIAKVAKAFPENERWGYWPGDWGAWGDFDDRLQPRGKAHAELALIALQRRDFVTAFRLLVRSDYWLDAAYVGERVLTLKELRRFVDRTYPHAPAEKPLCDQDREGCRAFDLRYLLARRLAREGHHREALAYIPPAFVEPLREYSNALYAVRSGGLGESDKALALWRAAKLARRLGIEMMGTELTPDWQYAYGSYELGDAYQRRVEMVDDDEVRLRPTKAELERVKRHRAAPYQRYHYRYTAANLAWRAAEHMPDEDADTAGMLCQAGSWLEARDPKAAERFYKALVVRNRTIPMAVTADWSRWFPGDCRGPP